ncbi:MAG: LTA synthase family protein [Granulosicoccus sp.]
MSDSMLSSSGFAMPLQSIGLRTVVRDQALLFAFALLTTLLCRTLISGVFDVTLANQYWTRDFVGNWAVVLITCLIAGEAWRTMIIAGVFIVFFQTSNALKLVTLGTPISPDDFFNVQNLFFLVEGWQRWIMYAIAVLPLILIVSLIRWGRRSVWVSLLGLALTTLAVVYNSDAISAYLDKRFGNSVWNQPANYQSRGLALHLTQETLRTIAKTETVPGRITVQRTLADLPVYNQSTIVLEPALASVTNSSTPPVLPVQEKRNLHMFVLESFFDPVSLGDEWVPEDPFPESFRSLWAQTGQSKTLSPVFGGYTANAEFEVLCGFPVTRNAVFFEGWLRRPVPCLPRVLSEAGYTGVASHPNVPGFWNRTHAYRLLGFDHYLSKNDFELEDSVNGVLLDKSLYAQIFDKLDRGEFDAPVFNYMLTYHGHLPYPGSERYPDRVSAGKSSTLLHGYLNQIWYKSRDLMNRVDQLRAEDPEALIVIFGDHLPFLGPNFGVYSEAWQLPAERSAFSGKQLEQLTSTPLIVIDGQRGPLALGKVPVYRLPALLLSLLGYVEEPSLFNFTLNPADTWVRPVYGMHISIQGTTATACSGDRAKSEACAETTAWLERTQTLIRDIFTGEQHSLR